MKRDVAVILTRAPYGRVHVAEGLRAARGVAAGFDEHDVTVIFTSDAVFATRKAVDRDRLTMTGHTEDLHDENGQLVVDRAALADRDIDDREVASDIEIVDEDAMADIVRSADHTLDF